MLEKVIVSRIKQKTATLSEWQNVWQTFIPLRGEQCVIIIPANSDEGEALGFTKSDSVRHVSKTGDGTLSIGELPWDADSANVSQALQLNQQEINKVSALVGDETVQSQITEAFDNRIFVGTRDEYTSAYNEGLISAGMIVCLTDEDNSLGINPGGDPSESLPTLSDDGLLQARSLSTLTGAGTLIL